jgi:serine/threonine-protein kinase
MSTARHDGPDRQARVDAVLAEYMQRLDRGQDEEAAQLLAEHADLAEDLQAYLEAEDEVGHLARPAGRAEEATEPPRDRAPEAATEGPAPRAADGDAAFAAGARLRYFGDYEVLQEIARGGMGVVYQARQVSLNRPVALKMILAGQLASPADVQRFRREAEAAANLDHPHIVPIYEIGEHDGQHYFSMKLIEGSSLSRRMHDLVRDPRAAARLLAQVARAVH